MKYVEPFYKLDAFNCPYCEVYADQEWYYVNTLSAFWEADDICREYDGDYKECPDLKYLHISVCRRCQKYALWVDEKMLFPGLSTAPLPAEDMPESVTADFAEARNVLNASPRGAAALLRLVLEKLMIELGIKGKDLNDAIGKLVQQGLPEKVQKALDSVRVIGNEAVHPGQIDLRDAAETASVLFQLVNWIVEDMITRPRKVDEIYEKLPQSKKDAIERRDGV